ncbi:MAG TPA: M48 family metalloprotease [Xanthobacteraceae bacterium]|jgi:predicted Zn-dependent protease|nr:M48 family metalloprotease [Xanthobacteraceae bacterium]
MRAIAALTAAAVGLASFPARPQTGASAGIPMIRDAEIEQLLRDYTVPIFRVAGLADQNIHVVIIDDKSFNAFVMDAHRIFINVGALMQATAPNQVIGVLAHETGHIVGGHLSKIRQELANVQTAALVGLLLGVGAIVAGARSGGSDSGNVGLAAITAPQALGLNHLLAYQRAQEESADRAGVRFLTMTGQSAKGMYDTFKRFADESLFSAQGANPYFQNHPMPQERMAALTELVKTPYWGKKDSPELQFRHDMMRAKLFGFTERPATVLAHYPSTDTSLPARYARAIAAYRFGDPRNAIAQIDGLLQAMPNYPYFYELKGQALLEGGHPADAIAPLRHAVQLAPNSPLIQILLAQAIVATNDAKSADEAISLLHSAILKEPEVADAYTTLAMAYARKNSLADADLASAQAAFARGDNKTARELAERAKQRFPIGSPGWVRADDIVAFNKNQKQNPLRPGQ